MTTQRKELLAATGRALGAAETFLAAAHRRLIARVAPEGAVEPERVTTEQLAAHAFAWMATYVEALRQIRNWAVQLDQGGALGELEGLTLEIAFGEYLAQLAGGIAMSQGEFARPQELGLADHEIAPLRAADAGALSAGLAAARMRLGSRLAAGGEAGLGALGVGDASLEMIREEVRRFACREIAPHAQQWHRRDELIPLPVVE
ncbi:MAG: acyl-CoA dehydrogenase family protein, partial [Alphaproteobacteria bacterium]|nr:acyl-CoA dehydrogenase family protein [Alphaproteobacteria bacterium]